MVLFSRSSFPFTSPCGTLAQATLRIMIGLRSATGLHTVTGLHTMAGSSASTKGLPLPLIAAALVSFAALYLTAERPPGLIAAGVILLASRFVKFRLPRDRLLGWIVRLVPMSAILLLTGLPEEDASMWYVKPAYTNLIGYLLAVEVIIQAWMRRPPTPPPDPRANALRDPVRAREASGLVLLLTAFIMTAAANTYERAAIQALAPVYALCIILSLRAFTGMSQGRNGAGAHQALQPPQRTRLPALLALRILAALLALLLGFGSIYFITRYEHRITSWAIDLLRHRRDRSTEIGLSSTPRLQGIFNPDASTTRVLLIQGPIAQRHLRALAFDTYEGREWLPSLASRSFAPMDPSRLEHQPSGHALRFIRLAETLAMLPIPLGAMHIEAPVPLEMDVHGTLRETDLALSYSAVVSNAPVVQGPLAMSPTPEMRQRLLAIPPQVDPAVIELARSVAGDGPPAQRIVRLASHLRSSHEYSLRFEPRGEPLSDFILNRRAAHCQYFASALVVMARAVEIPARFVSGYYAHEAYGENQMVVRDRDAHAWAEVWIDGHGWLTADATPPGGLPDGLFEEPSAWQRFWERIQDIPRIVQEWWRGISKGALITFAALFLLIVVLVRLWQWWRARPRTTMRAIDYDPVDAELLAAAKRFERLLARRGLACPANRTWHEHLALNPTLDTTAARAFVDTYATARFRRRDPQAIARVIEHLEAVEAGGIALDPEPSQPGTS